MSHALELILASERKLIRERIFAYERKSVPYLAISLLLLTVILIYLSCLIHFISDSSPYWKLNTWIGLHAGADRPVRGIRRDALAIFSPTFRVTISVHNRSAG